VALTLQGTYAGVDLWFDVNASSDVTAVRVVNPTTRTVRLEVSRASGNGPVPRRDVTPGTDQTITLPGNRRFKYVDPAQNWIVDAWPL
jgi:hypothetical protein